jgi:predicted PurR-regulated permease PerM
MAGTGRNATQVHAVVVLATLASLAFVKFAAELLIPMVLSVLAALALEPIVAWLTRHRLPRGVAAALILCLLLAGAVWGLYSLRDNLADAIDALPSAMRRAREMVESTIASRSVQDAIQGMQKSAGGGAAPPSTGGAAAAIPTADQVGATALSGLGHLTVIVFFVFFLLQSGPRMAARIIAAAGTPARREIVATILADVNMQVQRFLLVQAFTAFVVAVTTWLVLAWMGVQYPVLWGLLAGLFNSIPYFGPIVVSGGMFVVGLVQQGEASQAWQMAGAALVITSLEGWLITPPLMGSAERMNVLTVFVGLLVWTWLWGAWGTLLAVPMLAVLKSVADHVESMRPLGRLMAG